MDISYKGVTKDMVKNALETSVKNCKELMPGGVPVFDEDRVKAADIPLINELEASVEKIREKWIENFEFYCICEMALLYLERVKDDRKND